MHNENQYCGVPCPGPAQIFCPTLLLDVAAHSGAHRGVYLFTHQGTLSPDFSFEKYILINRIRAILPRKDL